jgi:hypothetical protein
MTWQRIDENTYIDDTLVTCAEYQLFIDEMREQGKYFQPDHWTSYGFPKGTAKNPILGVRFSDAQMFCRWLTESRDGDWSYRLLDEEEAVKYPIKNFAHKLPVGYWVTGGEEEIVFRWSGEVSDNPRLLNILADEEIDRVITKSVRPLDSGLNINNGIAYAIDYDNPPLSESQTGSANIFLDTDEDRKKLNLISELDFASPFDVEFTLDTFQNIVHEKHSFFVGSSKGDAYPKVPGLEHLWDFSKEEVQTADFLIERAKDRALVPDRSLALDQIIILDFIRKHTGANSSIKDGRVFFFDLMLDRAMLSAEYESNVGGPNIELLNVIIDLITLRERINGRSPAFEGIRLVKERMR